MTRFHHFRVLAGGIVGACIVIAAATFASGAGDAVVFMDGGPDIGFEAPSWDGGLDASFDSGSCTSALTTGLCAEAGSAGCGGNAGTGGQGGQGGGASIALYVSGSSHVTITHGAFFVGAGGQGGNGGSGGGGAAGMPGPMGSPALCNRSCDNACMPSNPDILEGGAGGSGGPGGSGGVGGGGAGGPTYYYACGSSAKAAQITLVTPGTLDASVLEGVGGGGGAPNGPDGATMVTNCQ